MFANFDSRVNPDEKPLPSNTKRKHSDGTALKFQHTDLTQEMYRLLGTDLTQVPGIGALTVSTLISEVGQELTAFKTEKHFCSWLGLCPGNRISGDKVLSSKTRHVASRAARAFRLSAQSLWHSQSSLGDYYRRMCAKLGRPAGNTATAHKLARIFYYMVSTGSAYDETASAKEQEANNKRKERRLVREASRMGYQLVPITSEQ